MLFTIMWYVYNCNIIFSNILISGSCELLRADKLCVSNPNEYRLRLIISFSDVHIYLF